MSRRLTAAEDDFLTAADHATRSLDAPWKTKYPHPLRANFGPGMARKMVKELRVAIVLLEAASNRMTNDERVLAQNTKTE